MDYNEEYNNNDKLLSLCYSRIAILQYGVTYNSDLLFHIVFNVT